MKDKTDAINSPSHYTQAKSAMEPIDVLRYAPFCLGNALKYIIRAGYKQNAEEDLRKAEFYIRDCKREKGALKDEYKKFFSTYGRILGTFERTQGLESIDDVQKRVKVMLVDYYSYSNDKEDEDK